MEVVVIESEAFKKLIHTVEQLHKQIIEGQVKIMLNLHPLSEKWLDNECVCELLAISKGTLQTYRDRHIMPFSKIGAKIYYKASDIEKHLTKHYKT